MSALLVDHRLTHREFDNWLAFLMVSLFCNSIWISSPITILMCEQRSQWYKMALDFKVASLGNFNVSVSVVDSWISIDCFQCVLCSTSEFFEKILSFVYAGYRISNWLQPERQIAWAQMSFKAREFTDKVFVLWWWFRGHSGVVLSLPRWTIQTKKQTSTWKLCFY